MNTLRVLWTLMRVLGHLLCGLLVVALRFPRLTPAQQQARVQAWAARGLELVGVRLEVRGQPAAQGPVLLVANHISWLDIVVLHASRFCRFISKDDIARWPMVGRLAKAAGTLFIARESRRDALRVVHHMTDSLRAGEVLAAFPEGTTSNGIALLPFHANLLQAAIAAEAPVQPVALSYLDAGTRHITMRACYIDDDTFIGSMWRTLAGAPLHVVVSFGEVQHARGRDRRSWADDLRKQVDGLRRV